MIRDVIFVDLTDVTDRRMVIGEVGHIGLLGVLVPFRSEYAATTCALYGPTQTPDTREKIDEGERLFCELRLAPPFDFQFEQADHALSGNFLSALPAINVAFRVAKEARSFRNGIARLREKRREVSLHCGIHWEFF